MEKKQPPQQTFEEKQWLPREAPRLNKTELTLDEIEITKTEGNLSKTILTNSLERLDITMHTYKNRLK